MSMLHAVLAARTAAVRRAAEAAWPAATTFAPGDVLVDGMSLAARARDEGTPTVCVAPAPAHATVPLDTAHVPTLRTVVLARVEHAVPALGGRHRQVWLECDLDTCAPVVGELYLLGRTTRARLRRWRLCPARPGEDGTVLLPDDLHAGDVLAVPCLGLVTPAELGR